MSWKLTIYLLVFSALILLTQQQQDDDKQKPQQTQRIVHRLIGGHLRIHHEDPYDTESLTASASGSKNRKNKKSDDDERKTLAQQVADGKYGLIQTELFTKPINRPGVLSYDANPEIPKDNVNNLGGLTKNDIWLAENHLLVIKGGHYPPHDDKKDYTNHQPIWPAIDNYKAPLRQVKIPSHPKVPPPFPVQLTDDGPLQILGTNTTRTINATYNPSTIYAIPSPEIYYEQQPGTGPFYPNIPNQNQANITTGQTPFSIPPNHQGELSEGLPPPPFAPFFPLNGTLPPFFASLPPGAAILPPPSNQTDQFDEDDPSIYYPPPYSFYYPKDNSTILVPPGPLVPGIILPPPPNFFAPLEETTTTRSRIKAATTTTPPPQIRPTTTALPPTAVLDEKRIRRPINIFPPHIPSEINNELKPIVRTTPSPANIVTILPPQTIINRTQKPIKRPSITVLKPVKTTTSETPKIYSYNNEISRKPFDVYGPPQTHLKTVITTTQVPLKIYYSSTNDIDTNSITQPPEKFHIQQRLPKTTTKTPAPQYYYYETQTTEKPIQQTNYYDIPGRYYITKSQNSNRQTQRPQYIYVTSSSSSSSPPPKRPQFRFVQQPPKRDSFSVHIAQLQKQIHQYVTTTRPNNYQQQQQQHSPKPVYQFSFQATNYRPQNDDAQDKFRPLPRYSVQIQPAVEILPTQPTPNYYQQQQQQQSTERPSPSRYYTTSKPDYDYDDNIDVVQKDNKQKQQYNNYETTSNPIYQGFYTKPDENYFDENTKEYFTTFGKKLPNTTPLPPIQQQQKPNSYRQPATIQKPISLQSDTAVNYLPPLPKINPNAEFIQRPPPANYPQVVKYKPPPPPPQQYRQNNQRPDIVKAIEVPIRNGQQGSFISYQLPGDDGAHFYFLTPQLAQSRDQGAGFYYEQDNVRRLRRNRSR